MAARISVQVLTGPNGSPRSARIDAILRESGQGARLLMPSVAQARARREELLRVDGCAGAWGTSVCSLTDFAHALLEAEGVAVTRLSSSFQRTLLLEQCLEQLKADRPDTHLARIPVTPGLVRHLLRVINDLKQAAIEPQDFATRIATASYQSSFDEGVALLYERFQVLLRAQGLFDVPGLYWRADEIARERRPRLLEGVDTLLWDGFDDFTPSEFRFVEALLRPVKRGVIGLNLDDSPDRQDRYALPLNTLRQLRERFDCQVVTCEGPEPRTYGEYAARNLFWREEPTLPAGLIENLRIVPCSDGVHELEAVARRVKALMVEDGVAPADIAIIHWNLPTIAGALGEVFEAFGAPCNVAVQRTIAQTGLGRTLLNLLVGSGDWARDAILDLLASPYLRAMLWEVPYGASDAPLDAIDAAAYYTRRAQILEGYKDWTFRLEKLRGQIERNESDAAREVLRRRPEALAELDALLQAMARLHGLQEVLPAKESAAALASALDAFLDDLTLSGDEDREALGGGRALLELLADSPGDGTVSRADFLAQLSRGMEETAITLRGTPGGVRCLDANQARNQRFAHVFVLGLMEGQAPAAPAGNAVYPEHDRERLHKVGIPVETNQEHHARQRMLFGHVLECAGESLTLSWAVTQDSGRESSPSPFLNDVRELFPDSVVAPCPRADSFLAAPELLASPRDVLNRALYDAPDLAPTFAELCAPCQIGAAVEQERHSDAPFGPFDAALGDPELVAGIAAQYGETHEFSVNQLETYISCPFSFYTRRVLHLEETELPDGTITALTRGSLVHRVLERFHEQFRGLHIREIGLDKADEAMEALVAEVFAAYDWSEESAPPAARTAEQAYLQTRLRRYLRVEHAQEKEEGWKPRHFEVAFGRTCRSADAEPSTTEAFVMDLEAGPVRFTGRIDRIDTAGRSARIIDYKSGGVPGAGEITGGQSIQLSVYAEAVEQLLIPNSQCTEARYLAVGKTDRREALGIDQKRDWPNRVPNMKEAIARAVDGIRSGYFPPIRAGKSCYGCGHARACRHEESRIARKSGGSDADETTENDE